MPMATAWGSTSPKAVQSMSGNHDLEVRVDRGEDGNESTEHLGVSLDSHHVPSTELEALIDLSVEAFRCLGTAADLTHEGTLAEEYDTVRRGCGVRDPGRASLRAWRKCHDPTGDDE